MEISDHVTTHLEETEDFMHMEALKKCLGQSVRSACRSISQSEKQSPMYSKWAATDDL